MKAFPIYILDLDSTTIVFPKDKADLGHTDFWEKEVSDIVAKHFKINRLRLLNLPYCQRRGRVVGSRIYYGEKDANDELLQLIRQATGEKTLAFFPDNHERRLREDVRVFRRLIAKRRK